MAQEPGSLADTFYGAILPIALIIAGGLFYLNSSYSYEEEARISEVKSLQGQNKRLDKMIKQALADDRLSDEEYDKIIRIHHIGF